MISILWVQRISEKEQLVFIVSHFPHVLSFLPKSPRSKERTEYFGHIGRSKDHRTPKEALQWKRVVNYLEGYLNCVAKNIAISKGSSNQSSFSSGLTLSALNVVENSLLSNPKEAQTIKTFSEISDEDVINIFI